MIQGGWVNEGRGRSGRRPGGRFPAGLTGAPAPFRQYFMDHAVCFSLISEISPPFTPHNFLERGILLIRQRSIFSKGTKKTTGITINPNGKFVPSEFWQGRGQSRLACCHLRTTHSTGTTIPAEKRAILVRRPEFSSGSAFGSASADPAELQHRAAAMTPSALGLPPNPEGKRLTEHWAQARAGRAPAARWRFKSVSCQQNQPHPPKVSRRKTSPIRNPTKGPTRAGRASASAPLWPGLTHRHAWTPITPWKCSEVLKRRIRFAINHLLKGGLWEMAGYPATSSLGKQRSLFASTV